MYTLNKINDFSSIINHFVDKRLLISFTNNKSNTITIIQFLNITIFIHD